ncbi:hypothetical protein GHT06_018737 [Daphnia sinensis]|uniref:Uncharacterized protein n=1 Tax=Daphnia sinensis TaxID=1820382 RepID=A0AAD5L5M7_9CRUS|nr:hypothetical protein GHT06_018737 [Daphnia sinensis]
MQDYLTPRSAAFQTNNLKGMIDQHGLAAMLMLLLLSIVSVTGRPLPRTDDWQRSAGTNGLVPYDTLLPCVEAAACAGRVFGSHSEDVSEFGNVPPCVSYGWVRCIQHAGRDAIEHSAHGRLAPPTKHYYYGEEKNRPIVETYGPSSQVPEAARYAPIHNQRIEWHNWGLEPNEAARRRERPSVESLEIPAEKRATFNMGVFQFHQTSTPPPLVNNKQTFENVRGNQRHESPGLDGRERPVEFHHGQQRFEQSSQQLMKPAKFGQLKNDEQHGTMRSGQNQLTHAVSGYEFLDNNLAEPRPELEHLPRSFNNEREQKTRPLEHGPQTGHIADAIQRFVKVEAPKPVEVRPVQIDGQLREDSNRLFHVTQRVEPIQPGGMDSRQFTEQVPVQRKSNELPQGFDQVHQRLTEQPAAQQNQLVKRPDVERQSLLQATRRPLEFQSAAKPIVQQPMNAQQRPSAKPLHDVKETIVWGVTGAPRLEQTTARPSERLEQAAVKPSSLIGSPEFIEPAKSSLESLLIRLNSAKDTQQADEQLTALLRFFAMPANQQPASAEEKLTDSSDSAPPFTGKHESNVVPFIAFSEPLPLEPASNNALF